MGTFINHTEKNQFIQCRVVNLTDYNSRLEGHLPTTYEHNSYEKQKKKIVPFTYFTQKQFSEFVKDLPDDEKAVVIGNVFIKQRKYKHLSDKYTEQSKINDKHYGVLCVDYTKNYLNKHGKQFDDNSVCRFDIHEAKETNRNLFVKTIGYAQTDNNTYVRLVKHTIIPFLILFVLILAILVGLQFCSKDGKQTFIPNKDGGEEITNSVDTNDTDIPPNYVFPQYTDMKITKKKTSIGLYNPKDNIAGVQYKLNSAGTDVARDADGNPITTTVNSSLWLAYELTENGKIIKDKDGNEIKTAYIEPGKQKVFNLYSCLSKGEHKITIHVTSYSFDDEELCTSYDCNINVTVKK